MCIICTAVVEDNIDREFLCDCVEALGGKPNVSGNTVCVEYNGEDEDAKQFARLFEQYEVHGISTLS